MTDSAVTMDFHPQPGPGRAKPWAFPVPGRGALANGLAVLRCHRPGQQVVAVEVGLDFPLDAEPDGLDGIATIMVDALSQGTATHTAEEFIAELERCGATLDTHADYLGARVSLEVPASRLPRALGLLTEALDTPTFPGSEIERLVSNRLDEIPIELANPAGGRPSSWRRSCSRRPHGCRGRARAPRTPSPGSTRRACARSTRPMCGPPARPRSSRAT